MADVGRGTLQLQGVKWGKSYAPPHAPSHRRYLLTTPHVEEGTERAVVAHGAGAMYHLDGGASPGSVHPRHLGIQSARPGSLEMTMILGSQVGKVVMPRVSTSRRDAEHRPRTCL